MLYFASKNVLFDYLLEIKKFKIKSKIQMVGNFVFCDTIKWAFQKGFSFCDNILKTNDFVRLCANLRQITARSQRYKKKDFKITRKQSFKDTRYKKLLFYWAVRWTLIFFCGMCLLAKVQVQQ